MSIIWDLAHAVAPADLDAARVWLTRASNRREARGALGLPPFRGFVLLWLVDAVRT